MVIDDTIAMTATTDILRDIAEGDGPRNSLLALGYAGWGPGQLDTEIQANGWLSVPADSSLVFNSDPQAVLAGSPCKTGYRCVDAVGRRRPRLRAIPPAGFLPDSFRNSAWL